MHWEFVVALVLAIPLILLPVAFIWYLNLSGLISAVRGLRKRRAARRSDTIAAVETQQHHTNNTTPKD